MRRKRLPLTFCSLKSLHREDVHKVDIMTFCQQKAAQSLKSETQRSRDSALLWQLLVLLCRQNGVKYYRSDRWAGAAGLKLKSFWDREDSAYGMIVKDNVKEERMALREKMAQMATPFANDNLFPALLHWPGVILQSLGYCTNHIIPL